MLTISKIAAIKLEEHLVHQCTEVGIGFRVIVNTDEDGQATVGIKLDRRRQEDEVFELGNVMAFLDSNTAIQIGEHQIDYLDEPDGGFILKDLSPTS
jgi:Fe-S cluster assembly iron-binding protein IscA